ncbi:hypothetical protein EDD29_1914 [Actinocorallia herbida]|uniref:Secreted protein n=1 Tax=Actinocorallia herbida TaxID=58109 RepID=A0A3N1CSV5_9ACTN|nr:hypothetical protein [Actinocorallia herbida]ROO84391.1 hypothetical protein EDD29_1914 [Actinocorallia herbida]
MRRLFWIGVGAGAALYAQRKAVRFVRSLTPQNLAVMAAEKAVAQGRETGHRLRELAEDVRYHAAVREAELTEAIELDQAPPLDPRGQVRGRILRARAVEVGPAEPDARRGRRELKSNDDDKDGTHGVG